MKCEGCCCSIMPTRIYQTLEMDYYCHALEALQMEHKRMWGQKMQKLCVMYVETSCVCPHTCLVKPKIIHACLLF